MSINSNLMFDKCQKKSCTNASINDDEQVEMRELKRIFSFSAETSMSGQRNQCQLTRDYSYHF